MKIILSKSAIEAATMIVDDQNLLNPQNRLTIESADSNLDYKEGKKLIDLLGQDIFFDFLKMIMKTKKLFYEKS